MIAISEQLVLYSLKHLYLSHKKIYRKVKQVKTLIDVFFRKLGKTYTLLITATLWIKETN